MSHRHSQVALAPVMHLHAPLKNYMCTSVSSSALQLALDYTEAQELDLLHLRRLFYGKLGQLGRERAALMGKMPSSVQSSQPVSFHLGFQHVAKQLAVTKEVADQLCANHAEESFVYQAHGFCIFRCVSFLLNA